MNTHRFYTGLFFFLACFFSIHPDAYAAAAEKKALGPNDITYTVTVGNKEVTCLLAEGSSDPVAITLDKNDATMYSAPSKKFFGKFKKKKRGIGAKIKAIKASSSLSKNAKKKKIAKLKEKKKQYGSLSSQKKLDAECANPSGDDDDDDDDDDSTTPTGLEVLSTLSRAPTDADIVKLLKYAGLGATSSEIQALKVASLGGSIKDVVSAAFQLGDTTCDQTVAKTYFDGDPAAPQGTTTTDGMLYALLYDNLKCNPFFERKLHVYETIYTVSGTEFPVDKIVMFERYMFDFLRGEAYKSNKNLSTFLLDFARHEAMLHFLNGDGNKKGNPNENFARELLELYTLGKVEGGLQRSSDAASHETHTEFDVVLSAKGYAGWTIFNNTKVFNPGFADPSGFQMFIGTPYESGTLVDDEDIINHITTNPLLARKAMRWFFQEIAFELMGVEPSINEKYMSDAEKIADDQLARLGHLDIDEAYRILLESNFFYDTANEGANALDPHTLFVSLARELDAPIDFTDPSSNDIWIGDLAGWIQDTGYDRMFSAGLPFHIRHLEQVSFNGQAGYWVEVVNGIAAMVNAYQNSPDKSICGGTNNLISLDSSTTAQEAIDQITSLLHTSVTSAQNTEFLAALNDGGTFDPEQHCSRVREVLIEVAAMRGLP